MSSLLLLSGGIDSACLAAWRRPALCLTIDYGQRAARAAVTAAGQVSQSLGLRHVVVRTDIGMLGSGCMVGQPTCGASSHAEFWPFRNQFLVTLAAMVALREELAQVMIGTVASDDRHVDGSKAFVDRMDQLLRMQEGGLSLAAPGQELTSEQLVQESKIPLEVLSWAHSCHVENLACGQCPGCLKHSRVMCSLGIDR